MLQHLGRVDKKRLCFLSLNQVAGYNHPFHDDSDDSVYNNIQSQPDEQLRPKTLQEMNSETMQYSDFQDHTGFFPEYTMEMTASSSSISTSKLTFCKYACIQSN
jgi:hypothetical protein